MIWPAMLFNLCVGLLLAGYLLRGVRRFERRADKVMAKLDQWHAEQVAKIERFYEEERRKYDLARDEVKVSLRAQVDTAFAEVQPTTPRDVTVALTGVAMRATAGSVTPMVTAPVNDRLPIENEIRKLPRWARGAFAARCARRVLPLVKHYWKGAPKHHLMALDTAVDIAERAAPDRDVARDADAAATAASTAGDADDGAAVASIAADAVSAAAEAAFTANAAFAARAANAAAAAYDDIVTIRSDFEVVRRLTGTNGWTDSAVPPSVFGPLWPEGPPKDWPKPEKPTLEVCFTLGVPDDMTTADAIELAKELSAALCALDLAGGGHGLAIQPPVEITAPVRTGCRI